MFAGNAVDHFLYNEKTVAYARGFQENSGFHRQIFASFDKFSLLTNFHVKICQNLIL